ncbi:MAG: UDP-N-acetylglucosamine--N-acetylmuramyl-(pentapeptide) pyrophosphoryl-undecaprenol N-acetylglucosamine transferase [Actinomycetota bacterium]
MKIAIAAGGTAGHVFPAMALYQRLIADGSEAVLLTDDRGRRYADGFAPEHVITLPSGGIVTGSIRTRLTNLGKLASGYRQARRVLGELGPDAVVGMGGYAAVGPLVSAARMGIRTVLHEQNSVMGLANKVSARSADVVALSFDQTEGARGNCVVTGNPCRPEVVGVGDEPFPTPGPDERIGILIMGGSQGARSVSERVPAALGALPTELVARLRVVHQARAEDHDAVIAAYRSAGVDAEVHAFVDVPAALADGHLVIARSGASTVCDVAVARRPAVYLPLLTHSDLQQVKNAAAVVERGGAILHREDQATVANLTDAVAGLLAYPAELTAMADAARAWSRPDAVDAIIELITNR